MVGGGVTGNTCERDGGLLWEDFFKQVDCSIKILFLLACF